MNIAITGGTGFIGQHVTKVLAAEGHHLYILTRNPKESEQNHLHYVQWLTEGAAPEHNCLPSMYGLTLLENPFYTLDRQGKRRHPLQPSQINTRGKTHYRSAGIKAICTDSSKCCRDLWHFSNRRFYGGITSCRY